MHLPPFISNRENFLRQLWEIWFLSAEAAVGDSSFKEAAGFFTLKSYAGFSFSAEQQTLLNSLWTFCRGAQVDKDG